MNNKGFVVLGPTEMGVKIKRGKPVKFIDSGYHWGGMLPGSRVERYSKKWYNLDFSATKVYTGEKEIEGVIYRPEAVIVDAVAYVRFPQKEENLMNILKAEVPREENELKTWIRASVIGTLRVILGGFSYRELSRNLDQIRQEVDEKFKETVIIRAGFERDNLVLTIEEIKLPPDLEKRMSEVNEERLKAEAAKYKAEAKGTELVGSIIRSMSEAYGIAPEEVQQKIKANPGLKKQFREISIEFHKREQAKEGGVLLHLYREKKEGNKESSSIEETLENFFVELLSILKSLPLKRQEGLKEEKTQTKRYKIFGQEYGAEVDQNGNILSWRKL